MSLFRNTSLSARQTPGPWPNSMPCSPQKPLGTVRLSTSVAISVSDRPSAIDALIVGIETQDRYLGRKKTWTRRIVLVTDGNSEIETEDWEATVDKMNELNVKLTIVGVDFDDPDWNYEEENKSALKAGRFPSFRPITGN